MNTNFQTENWVGKDLGRGSWRAPLGGLPATGGGTTRALRYCQVQEQREAAQSSSCFFSILAPPRGTWGCFFLLLSRVVCFSVLNTIFQLGHSQQILS